MYVVAATLRSLKMVVKRCSGCGWGPRRRAALCRRLVPERVWPLPFEAVLPFGVPLSFFEPVLPSWRAHTLVVVLRRNTESESSTQHS